MQLRYERLCPCSTGSFFEQGPTQTSSHVASVDAKPPPPSVQSQENRVFNEIRHLGTIREPSSWFIARFPYGHSDHMEVSPWHTVRPPYNRYDHCDHRKTSAWIMRKILPMMSKSSKTVQFYWKHWHSPWKPTLNESLLPATPSVSSLFKNRKQRTRTLPEGQPFRNWRSIKSECVDLGAAFE